MSQRERMLVVGLISFLLISIITTATTLYYYREYTSTNQKYTEYYQKYLSVQQNFTSIRKSVIRVTVKIDYGNGTSTTNDTVYLAPNTTVLDALRRAAAEVNATYWNEYKSWFINAINNVFNNEKGNSRWWVFSVNGEHALVSADNYELNDGDQIEWTYYQY